MNCSDWIAIVDVVITAILTAIIIFQTHKLNKKQLDFERRVSQRDEDLQKRQIQIDTFPYKREIYESVFSIFECCNYLKILSEKVDLNSRTGKELTEIFSLICKQYVPDTKAVLWSLREAEYILPESLSNPILEIRKCFDRICSNYNCLGTIESILTSLELQQTFPETKKGNLDAALLDCEMILSNVRFIESALPKELKIAGLNR